MLKFNLYSQSAPFLVIILAGDYAFSRIWITYEYIDKTIRSAIITLAYNMANLSFRAPALKWDGTHDETDSGTNGAKITFYLTGVWLMTATCAVLLPDR